MKHFLLLIILTISGILANAQDYKHSVGIRLGLSPGFEYRIFADETNSYKFLLSTRDQGMQLHLFKEFHQYNLFTFTDQLVFFYGAGFHVGYERWNEYHSDYYATWYSTRTAFITGLDGLAGLEYSFLKVPISLGIEVKPYFDFFGRESFYLQPFDFAFTAKYLF